MTRRTIIHSSNASRKVKCPRCSRIVSPVTIRNDTCNVCRTNEKRDATPSYQLTMDDVRNVRKTLFERIEWARGEDTPTKTKTRLNKVRKKLRDVTEKPSPEKALQALNRIAKQLTNQGD